MLVADCAIATSFALRFCQGNSYLVGSKEDEHRAETRQRLYWRCPRHRKYIYSYFPLKKRAMVQVKGKSTPVTRNFRNFAPRNRRKTPRRDTRSAACIALLRLRDNGLHLESEIRNGVCFSFLSPPFRGIETKSVSSRLALVRSGMHERHCSQENKAPYPFLARVLLFLHENKQRTKTRCTRAHRFASAAGGTSMFHRWDSP